MGSDRYTPSDNGELEHTSGRSVIPRRLPPVPSFASFRSPSPSSSDSSSPPTSIFSLSPSPSHGAYSPASSPGSSPPNRSPTKSLNALKRVSRPLPQVPGPRHTPSPSFSNPVPSHSAQLIVCRNCMNCVTTSESLLPASAVPPGSRAFRGFSGKASLFTECYSVISSAPRVQLMTTGAHTMQETFCSNCSVCLGWKIVKAHEWTEKWKEGNWLLELENLWLARSSDVLDSSPGLRVEREREREREGEGKRELATQPRVRRVSEFGLASSEYPKDALRMVRAAREQGLGLELPVSENGGTRNFYPQPSGSHHYSKSTPSFEAYGGGSAIHLPMTVVS